MILYLAGSESRSKPEQLDELGKIPGLALLTSYYAILQGEQKYLVDWATTNGIPMFLDSGAYSAMTQGIEIPIEDYTEFCIQNQNRFRVIASLDIIGDHEKSHVNHIYMKEHSVISLPTFHVREPFTALEQMLQENDYIAIGVAGMQKLRNQVMAWLTKVFETRERINPQCKLHGFALTSPTVIKSFDWYSVDSTTWLAGSRFGYVFVTQGTRLIYIPRGKYQRAVKMGVPREVIPPRDGSNGRYFTIDKWNAGVMLKWIQLLTEARLKKYNITQPIQSFVV